MSVADPGGAKGTIAPLIAILSLYLTQGLVNCYTSCTFAPPKKNKLNPGSVIVIGTIV